MERSSAAGLNDVSSVGLQFTAAACKEAFESLHGVGSVLCTRAPIANGTTTYTVTLLEFPDNPYQVGREEHPDRPHGRQPCTTD